MAAVLKDSIRFKSSKVVVVVIAVLLIGAALVFRVVGDEWPWTFIGSQIKQVSHLVQAVLDSESVREGNQGNLTNIIFLHHSTGENLIEEGGVREAFNAAGFDFWDHGYNGSGLRRPDGSYTGYSYNIPQNNTDPDGLAHIFAQKLNERPTNTLSGLFQHEVIILKSCFPASHIASQAQFEQYRTYYLAMRQVMSQHPEKLFILLFAPPLNPAATDAEAAARARVFANWLGSEEYLSGHPNVFVFDFFGQLAEDDPAAPDYNMLRQAYREGVDSHPNQMANQTIGQLFVQFVIDAIESYRSDARSYMGG